MLCACGCGMEVLVGKRKDRQAIYINGHSNRGINNPRYGKCFSAETIEKMSLAKLGKPSPHRGKKRPEISGDKNGMYNVHRFGKNGANYKLPEERITPLKKSIRLLPEMVEWKAQIRGRDNWTCQHCGIRGVWLEAHHIRGLSSIIKENNIDTTEQALTCCELWDLDNGITYCKTCHKLLKQKGGLL